jgi:hypothetical protein
LLDEVSLAVKIAGSCNAILRRDDRSLYGDMFDGEGFTRGANEITGPLMRSGHCHCSNCRKAHGAAFRSRARVRVEDFKWVQGRELVKYFESSPGFHRGFCSVCGSPIVNRPDRTPELGIALGGLDDDPGIRPERHFFVASKAPWFEITDDLPQHAELPPRSEVPGA